MVQAKTQTTPTPSAAPVVAGTARSAPSAAAVYEGLKAQRDELNSQIDQLQGSRREITSQLEDIPAGSPDRAPLEARLKEIDARTLAADQMLAGNSAQIAQAAAIPGAVVQQPRPISQGPPEEVYVLSGIFMFIVLLPLSIALARRIWKRSAAAVTSFPREFADRLSRMEQAVEATAVEVERIGEGQRFLTRLFTEGEGARVLGTGAAQPLEKKQARSPERLP